MAGARVTGPARWTGRIRHHYRCYAPVWSAETDGGGRFAVEVGADRFDGEDMDGTAGAPARAESPGHVGGEVVLPADAATRFERGEDVEDMEVRLVRATEVDGRVVDARGVPIPGARFWLSHGGRGFGGCSGWRADGEGRFSLHLDPDGTERAEAWAEALGRKADPVSLSGPFPRGGRVAVEVVIPVEGSDPRPDPGPWVLAGVVRDERGLPVPGAEFEGPSVRGDPTGGWSRGSDAEGRFEILLEGDPGLAGCVSVSAEGFGVRRVALDPGDRATLRRKGRIDGRCVVLPASSTVGGRVVDPWGRPVVGEAVLVMADGDGDAGALAWTRTDGNGRFLLEGLDAAAGPLLLVRAEGAPPAWLPLAGLLRPGVPAEVEIALRPGTTVEEVPEVPVVPEGE